MLKVIVQSCRFLVGSLFIISGLIKANDALGFMYKLEEYFETGALNFPELTAYALPLAVFICVGEILIGVALVLGALPRLSAVLTGLMMAFFTWLTWYTANCDPFGTKMIADGTGQLVEIVNQCVLACGCFGNAIPLTPHESFIKDVVLSVLTVPIVYGAFAGLTQLNTKREGLILISASLIVIYAFGEAMLQWGFPVLFAALAYGAAESIKSRSSSAHKEWYMAVAVTVWCLMFQYWTLNHLPVKDYRPYAVGENIIENRKTANDLGLTGPQYATEYAFRNVHSGADTVVLSSDWLKVYNTPWFKTNYEMVSFDGAEIKIAEGYEPRIMDFQVLDAQGEDLTDALLQAPGYLFLHVSKDLDAAQRDGQEAMNALQAAAVVFGWQFAGLTNAPAEENAIYAAKYNVPYPIYTCDQTELKIVVRSNPGLVLLKDGEVLAKWAWLDVPIWEDIQSNY